MKLSIPIDSLANYLIRQLNAHFPDDEKFSSPIILASIGAAIQKIEYCFSQTNLKYYYDGSQARFNHLNGDQYSQFLYYVCHDLFRRGFKESVCSKIYLLNKMMFGVDLFYEVELPEIFILVHPVGTVLGRGKYSNYLVVHQRCTVGNNKKIYPTIGEKVILHPGATVLGDCRIGNHCRIASNALIIDRVLEDNKIYFGTPKAFAIKNNTAEGDFWNV